jgi:hypothetical protein
MDEIQDREVVKEATKEKTRNFRAELSNGYDFGEKIFTVRDERLWRKEIESAMLDEIDELRDQNNKCCAKIYNMERMIRIKEHLIWMLMEDRKIRKEES